MQSPVPLPALDAALTQVRRCLVFFEALTWFTITRSSSTMDPNHVAGFEST